MEVSDTLQSQPETKLNIILPLQITSIVTTFHKKDFALCAKASAQSWGNPILGKLKHICFIYIKSTT